MQKNRNNRLLRIRIVVHFTGVGCYPPGGGGRGEGGSGLKLDGWSTVLSAFGCFPS